MKHILQSLIAALMVLALTSQVAVRDSSLVPETPGPQEDTSKLSADSPFIVYTFAIKDNIAAPTWRITQEAMDEADAMGARLVILHLNTYGGEVSAADSIRTKLLNARMPVWVFIDDNAASAGALIAIACDSIYMKPGGKIETIEVEVPGAGLP